MRPNGIDNPIPGSNSDPAVEIRKVDNWAIHKQSVEILFGQYTIGPYSIGMHECDLTYSELAPWINPNGPLATLASSIAHPVSATPRAEPLPPSRSEVPKQGTVPSVPKAKSASSGTAFSINTDGDFLTNSHVLEGCSGIQLVIAGANVEAKLVARDERNDLAIIKNHSGMAGAIRFRDRKGIRPADAVVALGFPYAGLLASSPQVTAGAVSALAGLYDDSRYLQFTAPVQPGNSGGPLLDLSGNLVGVVVGRINDIAVAEATGSLPQNINFAIKSSVVREFLDARGIAYLTASSDKKVDPADVGEAAAKVTVRVRCLH